MSSVKVYILPKASAVCLDSEFFNHDAVKRAVDRYEGHCNSQMDQSELKVFEKRGYYPRFGFVKQGKGVNKHPYL